MDSEYEIGYGKPPKEMRFRKGQSGNPKGRPKGTRNMATVFREVTSQLVPVKENGKVRYVTKYEVAVMQLTNQAAGGDFKAMRELFYQGRLYESAPDGDAGNEPDREKDQAVMARLLARMEQQTVDGTPEED